LIKKDGETAEMNIFGERILIVLTAFLLDFMLGDPHAVFHPVQGIGALITLLEKGLTDVFRLRWEKGEDKLKKRTAGALLTVLVCAAVLLAVISLLFMAGTLHPSQKLILSVLLAYQGLAARSLERESRKVYAALKENDLPAARQAVSMIVGRDTEKLDEAGVTKAAVETVAENCSDGVIAPLFYLFLAGVPGLWLYKAVNTMDSMIGYKNDRYEWFGTAAARLDDLLNLIPSRLAGLLICLAAYPAGLDEGNAFRIWRRDRLRHKSPNSAQTEAAAAGALSVQLAGDASYFGKTVRKPTIGDPIRPVEAEDIVRMNRLMYAASVMALVLGCLAILPAALL
jgi:adenosylcobinamide-phosphate synthase